jgi:hypothetical protein
MQKWLILPLGVLLSSCLSAAAQTPAIQVLVIQKPSAPLLMLVRVVPAQLPPAPVPPAEPAAKTLVGFTALLAWAESPDQGLKGLPSVEVIKTTFAMESRVPIVQLPGERLQLDGFASTHYLGNVLLGPSGLGHPGVRVPRSAWVSGSSLSFRLGRDAQTERHADGWRRLAWMVGAGRDRRI